jgi:hypothetical protein
MHWKLFAHTCKTFERCGVTEAFTKADFDDIEIQVVGRGLKSLRVERQLSNLNKWGLVSIGMSDCATQE